MLQPSTLIDLRSDTKTLPTPQMLEAITVAELGDDSHQEDPTVAKLEARAAELCGKEAALLVMSGSMANLVAMMTHTAPEQGIVLDSSSHISHYEGQAVTNIARLRPQFFESEEGLPNLAGLKVALAKSPVKTRLLCLENTHNLGGGRVLPLDLHQALCHCAHENGLAVHLDGARIFNAAVASGVAVSQYAASVDSLMFCLSKGLSCPLGSLLIGSGEFIKRARRVRKCLGGAMRQAGIIAAAGLVALDQMIDRLAQDHANCRLLAGGLQGVKNLRIRQHSIDTNILHLVHSDLALKSAELAELFKSVAVLVSEVPPERVRLVINRHHDSKVINETIRRIRSLFA